METATPGQKNTTTCEESWIPGLPASLADRIIPEPNTGCWLWMGPVNPVTGYGAASGRKFGLPSNTPAHRLVYLVLRLAKKNPGRQIHIHHETCGLRICCNPDHLLEKHTVDHASDHRKKDAAAGRGWRTPAALRRLALALVRRGVGVRPVRDGRSWEARIGRRHLGTFPDREAALVVRRAAVAEMEARS